MGRIFANDRKLTEPVQVAKLEATDLVTFKELISVFEDVFEMENFHIPTDVHLQTVLANDSFHAFVAKVNNQVVGGLTAYTLAQYYSTSPLLYLYDLAVEREWQRNGIGRTLMAAVTHYARENEMEEVFLQADLVDEHAIEFYRSTGAAAESAVQFSYLLK